MIRKGLGAAGVVLTMFGGGLLEACTHPRGGGRGVRNEGSPATEAPTVSILILSGGQSGVESGVDLSEIYTAARGALERHTALRVAPLDTIGLTERPAEIRACAGVAACFAQKVREVSDAEYLLTVSVDRLQGSLLLGLRLIEIGAERQIGAFGDEISVAMPLAGVMERTLPKVFPESIWGQVGEVTVYTEPSNAEVFVGSASCASPCTVKRLVPGAYPVAVRKSGFRRWQGSVTVSAGHTAHVHAELRAVSPRLLSNPWFWTGVGMVLVTAAVTGFVVLSRDDDEQVVCVAARRIDCELERHHGARVRSGGR